MDTFLKWTLLQGPSNVHLREVLLYLIDILGSVRTNPNGGVQGHGMRHQAGTVPSMNLPDKYSPIVLWNDPEGTDMILNNIASVQLYQKSLLSVPGKCTQVLKYCLTLILNFQNSHTLQNSHVLYPRWLIRRN